ncbi:MAG TPA: DNA alkylation repair protein [Candidatus Limnocylindrales bacterium]|nr:DNA alkylation repair protein [Candidatus Limnocylindrales bacterium]
MTMTLEETMAALQAKGNEQTRKTYLRHGAGEPLFGVKFGDLRPLAKRIGTDHGLAEQLWATGNTDARLLACMVADPARVSEHELDAWLDGIDTYFLVDVFVAEIAARTSGRRQRAERWIASDRDRAAQAGWDLMNYVAMTDEAIPDDYFVDQLDVIAGRITGYGNWTRRSASNAITGIGLRNDALEAAARQTAARMGHIEFDPGQTSCVMPDPIAYLEKTKAYRAAQAEKRAATADSPTR